MFNIYVKISFDEIVKYKVCNLPKIDPIID